MDDGLGGAVTFPFSAGILGRGLLRLCLLLRHIALRLTKDVEFADEAV
jgi:hypothetical protein